MPNRISTVIEGCNFFNLTPHEINVIDTDSGDSWNFGRSGIGCRAEEKHELIDNKFPFLINYKEFTGFSFTFRDDHGTTILDKRELADYFKSFPEVALIVSGFSVKGTVDFIKEYELKNMTVFVPDTGPINCIRDKDGKIIGVKSLTLKYPSQEYL